MLCVDDEQNMESFEEDGVDAGEVGGKDASGLRPDELRPRGSSPLTGRVDAGGTKDFPDC